MKSLFIIFFSFIVLSSSREGISAPLKEQELCTIEKDICRALHDSSPEFHGVVAFSTTEKKTFVKSFGMSDRENNRSMKSEAIFCIGSISKQMTATLIMQCVERGECDLSKSLAVYLSNLQAPWADDVTLHHLLTHSSGIVSLEEPLQFHPGTQFMYSNLGYDFLGKVLESIKKKPLQEIYDELFAFAKMENTYAPIEGTVSEWMTKYPALAKGYNENLKGEMELDTSVHKEASIPSGGILSCVDDLLKWNHLFHSGQLVKGCEVMATSFQERNHRWTNSLGYGYGLQICNEDNLKEISHSGYVPGYISTLIYYPEFNIRAGIEFLDSFWLMT